MKKLLYIILIFSIVSCNTSKDRIEVKLMDCIYSNYMDEGALFKQAMLDHEQYLITTGILKDATGDSYIKAFKKISIENTFNISETFAAGTSRLELNRESKESLFIECRKSMLNINISSLEKGNKLGAITALMGTNGNVDISSVANEVLELLNEDDFELNYYKLNAFLIFDAFKLLKNESVVIKKPELDLSNALKISINNKNELFVDDKKTELKNIKRLIIKYVKNNDNPMIKTKVDSETSYKIYIAVKNEITSAYNFLKDQSAKEKFNTTYFKLNENEKAIIDSLHEIKIVE